MTGCPVTRWDGPYTFRCGLGGTGNVCSIHGPFVSDHRDGDTTTHDEGRTMTDQAAQLHVYRDDAREWRWYAKASNGETVADSGEGYVNKTDAIAEARKLFPSTDILVHVGNRESMVEYKAGR